MCTLVIIKVLCLGAGFSSQNSQLQPPPLPSSLWIYFLRFSLQTVHKEVTLSTCRWHNRMTVDLSFSKSLYAVILSWQSKSHFHVKLYLTWVLHMLLGVFAVEERILCSYTYAYRFLRLFIWIRIYKQPRCPSKFKISKIGSILTCNSNQQWE